MVLLTTNANALELCGEPLQGEILKGTFPTATRITFNQESIPVSKDGEFLIAFSRDDNLSQKITIFEENTPNNYSFEIKKQKWDIQNIKGLPQKTVTPSKKDQAEIDRERKDIRGSLTKSEAEAYWKSGFIKPVEGRISGKFGGQRIMNGEPRNPHMGTDIAAIEGTEIKAASDGTITLAGFDYFYSGNVVVVDHGYGLFTIYAHMKDISVNKGDKVNQGDIIGTVGKTGRATGAHLHWGASLNGIRFEPMSLLKLNDNKFCFTL